MKTRIRRVFLALAFATAVAAAPLGGAAAQSETGPDIAVIDIQRLLRKAKAAVDFTNQIERQRQLFREQISEREKELRAADQELARQRTKLPAEAFAEKRREFEVRLVEVQREAQTRMRELDQVRADGRRQVQRAITNIVAEIARERGIGLVIAQQGQIVLVKSALDITEEVLKRLNEKLPQVEAPVAQD